MTEEAINIAKKFASGQGLDTVRFAGKKNGFSYYHIFSSDTAGHKLGIWQFIKISTTGKISWVLDRLEVMWAMRQEVKLNNL